MRTEMINAGWKIWEIGADKIQIDVIQRAGASRGAKQDFSARIFAPSGDAGAEKQNLREGLPRGRDLVIAQRTGCRNRSQGRYPGTGEMRGQSDRLQLGA